MPELLGNLYGPIGLLFTGLALLLVYNKKKRSIAPQNWLLPTAVFLMFTAGLQILYAVRNYVVQPVPPTAEESAAKLRELFNLHSGTLSKDLAFRSLDGILLNIPAGFEIISPNDGKTTLIARAPGGLVVLMSPQQSALSAREVALAGFNAAKNPTKKLVSESIETLGGREAFVLRSELEHDGVLMECQSISIKKASTHHILMITTVVTNPSEATEIFEDIANSFRLAP